MWVKAVRGAALRGNARNPGITQFADIVWPSGWLYDERLYKEMTSVKRIDYVPTEFLSFVCIANTSNEDRYNELTSTRRNVGVPDS